MKTLADAIEQAASVLRQVSDSPTLDAQVLMGHILEKPRAWVLSHPEHQLLPEEIEELGCGIEKLSDGIPLPYVLGRWEFYGLDFQLSEDVLIPRPETELLVEKAIEWLNTHPGRRWAADVGTGSGCIAVSLAHQVKDLVILASDISFAALSLARNNAQRHGVSAQIHYLQADMQPPVVSRFDLICANLPYIPSDKLRRLRVFEHEPTLALDGGEEGLVLIKKLLEESRSMIADWGEILLEIEASQGKLVKILAEDLFPRGEIHIWKDLAGHDRLLEINMIK